MSNFQQVDRAVMQPKYKVIADYISDKIRSREWGEGFKIPSEIDIADKFSASRMTARKAIDKVASTDLVERVPSIGTFVKSLQAQSSLLEIQNISDEIKARGHSHQMKVLSKMKVLPNDTISNALSSSGNATYRVVILHLENGIPIQQEERFVNAQIVPHFLEQDFSKITTNEYLTSVAPLTEAQITVEATKPSDTLRERLSLGENVPCLKITRVTYSHEQPVSYAVLYYPGDKYKLTSKLQNL